LPKKLENDQYQPVRQRVAILLGNPHDDPHHHDEESDKEEEIDNEEPFDEGAMPQEAHDHEYQVAKARFFSRLDALEYDLGSKLRDLYTSGRDPELIKYVLKRYGPKNDGEESIDTPVGRRARQNRKKQIKLNREDKDRGVTTFKDKEREEKRARNCLI